MVLDVVVLTKQTVVVGSQINLKEVGFVAGLKPCGEHNAHRVLKLNGKMWLCPTDGPSWIMSNL